MFGKKKGYDEREERTATKIGAVSFYVMFFVCAVVIIAELIWKGDLTTVLGETIVLLAGGITCIIGALKNGLWSKTGRKLTVAENLMWSVVMSGIFSVLYAAAIIRRAGETAKVAKATVLFFLGIAVVGFLCLTILGRTAQRKKEREEKKYSE